MALLTLKKYPTDKEREGPWDLPIDVSRKRVWYFLERICALKHKKIVWPDDFGNDIWIITVDGTHCWIIEPMHPEWSQDKDVFSHKYNKAGINYELGIAISSSDLVWMNGPFNAGQSDKKVFNEKGLKEMLKSLQKKAIGDQGYNGDYEVVSTYNAHDTRGVKKNQIKGVEAA